MAQKSGMEHCKKKRMLEGRGAFNEEEGNSVRGYKAMCDDNFLRSWLREDKVGKVRSRKRRDK